MKFKFTIMAWVILLGILPSPRFLAQAPTPPYIAGMPTVDAVMKAMQASDPDETAARQMGAFWQLKTMIEEIAGPRYYRPGLSAQEAKLRQAYYTAYFQISNSKPQYESYLAMRGYDVNPKFRAELIQKLFPPGFAAEYPKLMAQANSQTQAVHNQAEQNRAQQAAKDQAQAQQSANQQQAAIAARQIQPPMSPEQRAMNRCITSGRLAASCTGNSLLGGLTQMISSVLPSAAKEAAAGPNMAGVFQGAGNWRLDFITDGVLVNCSILSPNQQSYRIEFKNNRTAIVIDTTPKPLDLTLRSDGTIVGTGPVTIDGVIASGYVDGAAGTNAQYKDQNGNLYDSAGNRVAGNANAGHTVFSPKTATCPALNLSSKGAGVGVETMQTDLLKTMFGGDKGPPTPPGIRMHGIFAASTGFSVQFFPESVILGCGPDVARAYPYTVRAEGSRAVIKVDAPDHPLSLVMKPDGTLDPGSGPYDVQGRIITGQNSNDDFTFAPRNATCNLAVLAPGEIPSTSVPTTTGPASASTAKSAVLSTPAAPTGNAVLVVTGGLASQAGAPNPLAGHTFILLNQSYESTLASAGFQEQAGMSAVKAFLGACANRQPACQQGITATNASTVSGARADSTGKGQLPGVPPGTYYFFCMGGFNNQLYKWDFKIDLKPGMNPITLDLRNAAPVN
ncbi:MAG TPA: hypothetical protein VKV95_19910 [Terriglobia bacterium]|nr:hypothetical protein [Terriglobia bacterium]